MPKRRITSEERSQAIRSGREEGAVKHQGKSVSVEVDEMTDDEGKVIYTVKPVES